MTTARATAEHLMMAVDALGLHAQWVWTGELPRDPSSNRSLPLRPTCADHPRVGTVHRWRSAL